MRKLIVLFLFLFVAFITLEVTYRHFLKTYWLSQLVFEHPEYENDLRALEKSDSMVFDYYNVGKELEGGCDSLIFGCFKREYYENVVSLIAEIPSQLSVKEKFGLLVPSCSNLDENQCIFLEKESIGLVPLEYQSAESYLQDVEVDSYGNSQLMPDQVCRLENVGVMYEAKICRSVITYGGKQTDIRYSVSLSDALIEQFLVDSADPPEITAIISFVRGRSASFPINIFGD